jgi:hypothetical protein
VFTLSEYETACRAAHKNLAEYVVLENTLDFDKWLLCMHATPTIHKDITSGYVFELTTSIEAPGKVFLRQKHRMGQSVPFSPRTVFYPHPEMPGTKNK